MTLEGSSQDLDRRILRLFLGMLVCFTAIAYVPIVMEGTIQALGGLAIVLWMWAPGFAAILAAQYDETSTGRCGLAVHRRTRPWLLAGLLVPAVYTVAIHLSLARLGLVALGGPNLSPAFLLAGWIGALLVAMGEEIGWRGLFTPLMVRRLGFVRGSLVVGLVWALYHYPAILLADYDGAGGTLFGLVTFTAMVVLMSLFLGATRMRSGSMWPAAVFHATHNLLFLYLFAPVVARSPAVVWLLGEQGALLCAVMAVLAAVGVILQRRAPPGPPGADDETD